MKHIRSLDQVDGTLMGGAVAIGNFDGVHRGHASLVERLIRHAHRVNGPAVILTFEPHPVRLLRPHVAPPPLTWTERKAALLEQLHVDGMIVYPTDAELLSLSPQAFFRRIVSQALSAKAVVEGPNFFFGKDRAGDIHVLESLCRDQGIELEIVHPVQDGLEPISSSRIRKLLADGDIATATPMLTQPYRLRGMVTHGAARGQQLGFPTANLDAVDTLIPLHGVYAGRAYVDERSWPAAINIGPNPTFGERSAKLEVHLIGYQGSLYGQPLEVDFLARLRDIHTFSAVAPLLEQLRCDVHQTVAIVDRFCERGDSSS